jgi:hypothetical protein
VTAACHSTYVLVSDVSNASKFGHQQPCQPRPRAQLHTMCSLKAVPGQACQVGAQQQLSLPHTCTHPYPVGIESIGLQAGRGQMSSSTDAVHSAWEHQRYIISGATTNKHAGAPTGHYLLHQLQLYVVN